MAFNIKQCDRRPLFVVVLKDNFGEHSEAVVDLTTATSAVFNMRGTAPGTASRSTAAPAPSPTPPAARSPTAGAPPTSTPPATYQAEIEIIWNDGKAETFPNDGYWDVVVTDDIA